MSILEQLSSQIGDRSEESNRNVVAQCLDDPHLLKEISTGLASNDAALVGDCAEIFTMVAEKRPEFVVPYAENLKQLLSHKKTRARWEAVHALSLITSLTPNTIKPILHQVQELITHDESIIVRDYAVDIVANFAKTSIQASKEAYPILKAAAISWEGRHAGHALKGLEYVVLLLPEKSREIENIAAQFLDHKKGVVRKAAKSLINAIQSL